MFIVPLAPLFTALPDVAETVPPEMFTLPDELLFTALPVVAVTVPPEMVIKPLLLLLIAIALLVVEVDVFSTVPPEMTSRSAPEVPPLRMLIVFKVLAEVTFAVPDTVTLPVELLIAVPVVVVVD